MLFRSAPRSFEEMSTGKAETASDHAGEQLALIETPRTVTARRGGRPRDHIEVRCGCVGSNVVGQSSGECPRDATSTTELERRDKTANITRVVDGRRRDDGVGCAVERGAFWTTSRPHVTEDSRTPLTSNGDEHECIGPQGCGTTRARPRSGQTAPVRLSTWVSTNSTT